MSTFTKSQIFKALNRLGEEDARARIALGYFGRVGSKRRALADEWAKAQERKRNAKTNVEMAELASRAAEASERAALASELQANTSKHALITAIIAAIISAVAFSEATFRIPSKWF